MDILYKRRHVEYHDSLNALQCFTRIQLGPAWAGLNCFEAPASFAFQPKGAKMVKHFESSVRMNLTQCGNRSQCLVKTT